jgi:hypothetical protein
MAAPAHRNRASRSTRARSGVRAPRKEAILKAGLPRVDAAGEDAEREHLQRRLAIIQREFARLSAQAARNAPSLVGSLAEVVDRIREADVQLTRPDRGKALPLAATALGQAAAQLALIEYRLDTDSPAGDGE